jgi:hypothetical protein
MRESIIEPAWQLTENSTALKRFNFLPSLISTLYLSLILAYQIIFAYINLYGGSSQVFATLYAFVDQQWFWGFVVVVSGLLVLYIFLVPFAKIGLISLIEGTIANHPEHQSLSYAISQGMLHFLPTFHFNALLSMFKLLSITTFYLALLRIMGTSNIIPITIVVGGFFGMALVVNMLGIYSSYCIIFEKKKAYAAFSLSTFYAIKNIGITLRLYLSLMLVYIRTFIAAGLMLVFPLAISAVFTYITSQWFTYLTIGVVSVLFVVIIVFISHLNSVVEIFVEAMWYHTYQVCRANATKEDLQ